MLNRINGFAIIGSLGLIFAGMVACSDDKTTSSREEGEEQPVKIESTIVIDENGNQVVKYDTIPLHVDSVRTITEKGDTVYKYDTTYVPADTTLHWVGNSAVVITEISPVNLDWLDENGGDPGWIELYNAGDEAANLKGYSLVENLAKPRKWVFGDELIAAKSFRTVFCDKGNVVAVDGGDNGELHNRTHTNWKLERSGGSVYLIDPYYGVRDSVNYPELSTGMSWGIVDGGAWKYFEKPTPEQPNTKSTAYDGVAPKFDFGESQGGFYNQKVVLAAPKSLPDGMSVRCTKDGSAPTKNSEEFKSDMTIENTTVLRCAAFKEGLITKDIVTNTYFIDESVNMPVVAVSVDPVFFEKYYKKTNGGEPDMDNDLMYAPNKAYPDSTGEYPAHVEYFEKGSKKKTWDAPAGISLMGGWSRMERKKSVAVVMREEYGGTWVHYPLFETRKSDKDKYKGFNLRNNGNRFVSDYFADAVGGAILEGSGVDYQRSRQVVVFYNGNYYGIHDMRERYNKNFVESNYGYDASSVTFLKHLGVKIEASNGSPDEYIAMLEYAAAHDFSTDNDAYAYMTTLMDMGNFARYMLAEMYVHNGDWPNNNVRIWKSPESPLWKFMVYDLDHGFDWEWGVTGFSGSTNMFKWVKQGGRSGESNKCYTNSAKEFTGDKAHCFHVLYTKLIQNPKFKSLFINQASVMLDAFLNKKNVEAQAKFLAGMLNASEVERDMSVEAYKARRETYPHSFDPYGDRLAPWAESRDSDFLSEIQGEFELGGTASVTIASQGNGVVLMDGAKLPSNNYKGKFFTGNTMELTAVPNVGAVFSKWSDGSADNPHVVNIDGDNTFTAIFE